MKNRLLLGLLGVVALIGAALGQSHEKTLVQDRATGALVGKHSVGDSMAVHGHYHVTCIGADGNAKWEDDIENVVTTLGKNWLLDNGLNTSATNATNVYMGLKSSGTAVAADTMASHASWTELNISSSSGVRQSVSFSSAASGTKSTSSAVSWSITTAGPTTVAGIFIVLGSSASTTNGNTSGTLYSAGDFSVSRSVLAGDTLNITYSSSLT
jgi:hypothetical protein